MHDLTIRRHDGNDWVALTCARPVTAGSGVTLEAATADLVRAIREWADEAPHHPQTDRQLAALAAEIRAATDDELDAMVRRAAEGAEIERRE